MAEMCAAQNLAEGIYTSQQGQLLFLIQATPQKTRLLLHLQHRASRYNIEVNVYLQFLHRLAQGSSGERP